MAFAIWRGWSGLCHNFAQFLSYQQRKNYNEVEAIEASDRYCVGHAKEERVLQKTEEREELTKFAQTDSNTAAHVHNTWMQQIPDHCPDVVWKSRNDLTFSWWNRRFHRTYASHPWGVWITVQIHRNHCPLHSKRNSETLVLLLTWCWYATHWKMFVADKVKFAWNSNYFFCVEVLLPSCRRNQSITDQLT